MFKPLFGHKKRIASPGKSEFGSSEEATTNAKDKAYISAQPDDFTKLFEDLFPITQDPIKFKEQFGQKKPTASLGQTEFESSNETNVKAWDSIDISPLSDDPTKWIAELRAITQDPSKAMLPEMHVQARSDVYSDAMKKCVEKLSANIATNMNYSRPLKLEAVALLPKETWQGPFSSLLTQICGFYPCHPLNTMLLPTTEIDSAIFDLPVYSEKEVDTRIVNHFLEQIFQQLMEYKNKVIPLVERGDVGALDDMGKQKKIASWRVVQLAYDLGTATYGQKTMERHIAVFGSSIGWPENILEIINRKSQAN
jgi:hypothetical protein